MITIKFVIDLNQEVIIPSRHIPRAKETVIINKNEYIVENVEYDLGFDLVIIYLLTVEI